MRFFFLLLAVAVLLAFTINFSPDLKAVQGSGSARIANFDPADLQKKHGISRNFSHSQTRGLYHAILKDIEATVDTMASEFSEPERAVTCSIMRANARKYTRTRDSLGISEFALQVRDSYMHALRFLPLAVCQDVKYAVRTGVPSLKRTGMTLKQTYYCFAPELSGGECPTYTFLREVRGRSDGEILQSCVVSNRQYDSAYGK